MVQSLRSHTRLDPNLSGTLHSDPSSVLVPHISFWRHCLPRSFPSHPLQTSCYRPSPRPHRHPFLTVPHTLRHHRPVSVEVMGSVRTSVWERPGKSVHGGKNGQGSSHGVFPLPKSLSTENGKRKRDGSVLFHPFLQRSRGSSVPVPSVET